MGKRGILEELVKSQTSCPPSKEKISAILKTFLELLIILTSPENRFKWFLTSLLFAKRISATIAKRTYRRFEEEELTTPDRILAAGWDMLVQVLDS